MWLGCVVALVGLVADVVWVVFIALLSALPTLAQSLATSRN